MPEYKVLVSRIVPPETFEKFEVWRKNQKPHLNMAQGLVAMIEQFAEEHEKEIKKFMAEMKKEKEGKAE